MMELFTLSGFAPLKILNFSSKLSIIFQSFSLLMDITELKPLTMLVKKEEIKHSQMEKK
jgi:hypothetical protein